MEQHWLWRLWSDGGLSGVAIAIMTGDWWIDPICYYDGCDFRKLPIPRIMSEILMYIGASPSQIASGIFSYFWGFINICWACGVPPSAKLFFYFHKLQHNEKNSKRVGLSRCDQKTTCVAHFPSNNSNWQYEYFFIDSSFRPKSREMWVAEDELSFHVSPPLNMAEFDMVIKFIRPIKIMVLGRVSPSVLQRRTFVFKLNNINLH